MKIIEEILKREFELGSKIRQQNDENKSKKNKGSKSKNNNLDFSNKSSKNKKMSFDEEIKNMEKLWSDRCKNLFSMLLKHIWKTSTLIGEDVLKVKKY